MLTLHRNANTIVTDESFSVKLKWVNPACYFDAIPGDVGLGLEISVNEYTRAEFGNPERFEKYAAGQDRKFPGVSIRFGGALLLSGTLVITNATRESYSGWLQSELGVLGTAQRDKFITEMEWKANQSFVNKTLYNPLSDDYACVTIQNPTFWEGKGKSQEFTITYLDEFGVTQTTTIEKNKLTQLFESTKGVRVNRMLADFNLDITGDACVISPYLSLNRTVSELFRLNGFFIDYTSYTPADDYDYFATLIYNNYNIFKQTFTVETVESGYFDQFLTEWVTTSINEVKAATWNLAPFNYADLLPRLALKDFILSIQNFLNIAFVFRSDNTVNVINRNDIPVMQAYDLESYFSGFWNIGERKNVSLKFLQEYDKTDELTADWHDLSERLTDFLTPVVDIAALKAIVSPQLGNLCLVTSLNKIYEYRWAVFDAIDADFRSIETDVLEWIFVSTGNQPYLYGTEDEVEEIKTNCSTLPYNNDGSVLYPETLYTKQHGNISSSRSLWSDFSMRLIHYDRILLDKDKLEFAGTNGIFNRRWLKWARFWKNRLPVEGEFMLPLNELYYVINHITQPYSTRHGKFIIEEMECDFQGSQMGLVKIKGYKLD